jgi:hypothetical protein
VSGTGRGACGAEPGVNVTHRFSFHPCRCSKNKLERLSVAPLQQNKLDRLSVASFLVSLIFASQGQYSQHFIFFVAHEWHQ